MNPHVTKWHRTPHTHRASAGFRVFIGNRGYRRLVTGGNCIKDALGLSVLPAQLPVNL